MSIWQSILISIAASLIATGLVAVLLVKIFRVPNFDLHLDYIRGKMTDKGYSRTVLDISIINKKRWLGFGKEGVYFGLYFPLDFIVNKNLHLITTKGMEAWHVDIRGKETFHRDNTRYFLYRGVVNVPVQPDSRTHFLRISDNFDKDTTVRIYYYFETPYGRFPKSLKFGERTKKFESGKLPHVEVKFD